MKSQSESVVADWPPSDGREWDCQCARCGSSCDWERCCQCTDGYMEDDWGDDVVEEIHLVACQWCKGHGGWMRCLSSSQYCEANPLEGRAEVRRGQIEWYTFDHRTEGQT